MARQEVFRSEPLFILGAEDPEMRRVIEILAFEGIAWVFATHNGQQGDVNTAYKADVPKNSSGRFLYCIECDFQNPGLVKPAPHYIDHHRLGDAGFNEPPENSWSASSLGQLCTLLEREPQANDLAIAAMDHSFAAAVRGEIQGVSTQEVVELDLNETARHTGESRDELYVLLRKFDRIINSASTLYLDGTAPLNNQSILDLRGTAIGAGYSASYLSLRLSLVMKGCAALITTKNRDSPSEPTKVMLIGDVKPSSVESFIHTFAENNDLYDIYGVPSRGFAGGYIPRQVLSHE